MLTKTFSFALVALSATLSVAQQAQKPQYQGPQQAVCVLVPMSGSEAHGPLVLSQREGYVQVTGQVEGIKPGEHGFHIHMFGDLRSKDGMSAGGHFNPGMHMHGGPNSPDHHAGDLGNIKANDQGVADVDAKAEGLRLFQVLGRSIVVHADPDDLKSQPSGNSGARIAVGVIGLAEVKPAAK